MAATDEHNPLAEGLQLRRRPDSCILVIFGASGDLTAKKLMPALYALAVRGLLPEHFGIVGAARSEESDDQFRERMKQAVKDHARDPFEDEAWEKLAGGMRYTTLDFADDKGEDDLREVLTSARRGARHAGQPRLLLRRSSRCDRDADRGDRRAPRCGGLDPADHREAVRARPCVRPRAERADPAALRGGRGLPHRPLPGQGDGPEHAGAAVCERHLRADLEPPVHRPRADHGRRVDRHRRARRVLRGRRRDPGHLSEPPAAVARDHGDGAADRLHRRFGAEREGEGAQVAAHAGAEAPRARAVRAGVRRGAGGARVSRGGGCLSRRR